MKNAYLVAVSQLDFLDNRELSLQDIYSLCQMHSFTFPRHKIQMTRYLNLFPVNMAHRERTAIGQKPRLFQGQLQGPAFHSFTRLNPSFTSGKLTHSTNFGRSLRLFARRAHVRQHAYLSFMGARRWFWRQNIIDLYQTC